MKWSYLTKKENIIFGIQWLFQLAFIILSYRWMKSVDGGYEAKIVFWGYIGQLSPQILNLIFKINIYIKAKRFLKTNNCQKVSIKDLFERAPETPRLSIIGLGNVGKTTLIECILQKPRENIITTGVGAYIKDFPGEATYFAMLDANGQNLALQLDNALRSKNLIILLDHNASNSKLQKEPERISDHTFFLQSLNERLQASDHKPDWIHFLLNKKDLWNARRNPRNQKQELSRFFLNQVNEFIKNFPSANITYDHHSNNDINDVAILIAKISKNLI